MHPIDILKHYRELELARLDRSVTVNAMPEDLRPETKMGICMICGPAVNRVWRHSLFGRKLPEGKMVCGRCYQRKNLDERHRSMHAIIVQCMHK